MPNDSEPNKRRIVFAGLGALISAAAIVGALILGPPSQRGVVPPNGPDPAHSSAAVVSPPDGEQPVVLESSAGTPLLVGARTEDGKLSFTLPGRQSDAFVMDVGEAFGALWGTKPVWVNVAASWCLPCLWELEPLFESAKALEAAGTATALAIVDAEGDAGRGLEQLLAKRAQLPQATALVPPASVIALADDRRGFNRLVDRFFTGQADRAIRKQGIPLSLLFDRCGHLVLVAQNRHNSETFKVIRRVARPLAREKSSCR